MTATKPRSPAASAKPAEVLPLCAPAPLALAPLALPEVEDPCAPPEPYDPAEYRWVPVRRRARYDGWTEEKQRRFIEVLADTGQVRLAARDVGMTRENAYRLRRAPHAAAFARAWDAARAQAGSLIEDVAFERALEGIEHNVYDEHGAVVCTKRVFNDRLLMFLLRNLKPERYARHALATLAARSAPPGETIEGNPGAALIDSLSALEPHPPVAPEALLGADTLADELELAEAIDGALPHFLREQRAERPAALVAHEAEQAQLARGKAAEERQLAGEKLSDQEFADLCKYYDPADRPEPSRKRYR